MWGGKLSGIFLEAREHMKGFGKVIGGVCTFATWLYVERTLGVEEKFRREERGEGKDFLRGKERGSRIEGIRKRWSIEAAIVVGDGWMGER